MHVNSPLMLKLRHFLLLAYSLINLHAFSQDTATLKRIRNLSLNNYLEIPTYIINKDYVVFEYKEQRIILEADVKTFKVPDFTGESGIALDRNGIYFQGKLLKTDIKGFEIIGRQDSISKETENKSWPSINRNWLWKTNYKAYKNGAELTGVDGASFEAVECLNGCYFKDKNALYYFDKKIIGSDPSTVNKSCGQICYDQYNIYNNGKIWNSDSNERFLPVNDVIIKTKTNAIALSNTSAHGDLVVKAMDAPSLRGLSRHYSIDKKQIYYDTIPLPIKKRDFGRIKIWDRVNSSYLSDGIHVYAAYYIDSTFDAKSFGMFPNSDFCYDKNGAYQRKYDIKKNKVINQKFPFKYSTPVNEHTMLRIGLLYYIYKHQIYDPWDDKLYANVSDTQIEKLKKGLRFVTGEKDPVLVYGNGYYVSRNKLYYKNLEVKNVDAKSLSSMGGYMKDKNHVYSTDDQGHVEVFSDVDPLTFSSFTNRLYKDKNYLYSGKYKLISSSSIQLLAIFRGDRSWHGDEGDGGTPDFDHYFFKNDKGYWLITNLKQPITSYLGATFNPSWNEAFAHFVIGEN